MIFIDSISFNSEYESYNTNYDGWEENGSYENNCKKSFKWIKQLNQYISFCAK